jgi:short-subunit dehydrogenase
LTDTAVITGATSGIGRATALRLARKGYNVVLAARRSHVLEEVAEECRRHGVEALVVAVDVSKQGDVQRLAQMATDRFDHIDVWINNAAVTVLGPFTSLPTKAFRQVIETNFFGVVYGSQVALEQFVARGKGTLINISSMFGAVPSPYESPYIASKFAVRGLSATLRQELMLAGHKDVHVCTVMPAAIDTPIYRNAANITEREVKPPPPIYPVKLVADAIAELTDQPQDEVIVGASGRLMSTLRALLPTALLDRAFARFIDLTHFTGKRAEPTPGNLFVPSTQSSESGDWRYLPPKARKTIGLTVAAGAVIGVGILLLRARKQRSTEES